MALVDDVTITIHAGNGGDGGKSVLTVTSSPKSYPDGGDGGRGGNIYFQATSNVSDLSQFRFQKRIKAQDGGKGMNKNQTGRNGKDTYILVPLGTRIIDEKTGWTVELIKKDKPFLIARGGQGGEGNHNYKLDLNNFVPQRSAGEKGEEKTLHLVLSLIADVGLIGLPNTGKSSLLDVLTNANPKIGNYSFTTLEPNLGVLGKNVLADIPGLIEGASKGKGLGITFLKHIEKTKMLMHCIDATDPDPLKTYTTVRNEFKGYSQPLLEKEEVILLTKKDLISDAELQNKIQQLEKLKRKVIPVSIYDEQSIQKLKRIIDSVENG